MSDAPERIWVAPWREGDWSEGDWDDNEGKTLNDKPCIQYVRADRIEALTKERDSLLAGHRALNIGGARLQDRAETAEAKLAKAVGLLVAWVELSEHCSIEEGVCCCGDNMENHTNPMDCGHMPLDHGTYIAGQLEESTRATLAEIKGESRD